MTPEQQKILQEVRARKATPAVDRQKVKGQMIDLAQTELQKFGLPGRLASGMLAIGEDPKGAAFTAAQGPTFGFSDEIVALLSPLKNISYQEGLDELRAPVKRFTEANPNVSMGLQAIPATLTGMGAASKIQQAGSKIVPKLSSTLSQWAAKNPGLSRNIGLSSAGAISAGTYAAGTGEGDVSERLSGAIPYAGLGAVAAPTLGSIISSVAKAGDSALAKFADKFGAKTTAPKNSTALTEIEDFVPALQQPQGEMFAKTAGQRTQNAETQRLENSAVAGNLKPFANESAQTAMTLQNRQFKNYLKDLSGDIDQGKDINSIMDNVVNTVKGRAGESKAGVNHAYELAREGGNVKIGADDIRQGLFKNIAGLRRDGQYDLTQMPQAKNVVKKLARLSKGNDKMKITQVKLHALENWRTAATTAANNAQGAEKDFLKKSVKQYDQFMEKTASEAVDTGDADAINAFKNAVKSRREYGQLYESNNLVESIVKGEKSVDDTVKDLIGAGAIKGKREMANNLDAILKASKGEVDNVKDDLRQAMGHKILRSSESGFEPNNPDATMISPAKLVTNLENLFVDQRDFAVKLYGEDAVKTGLQAIKELKLIARKQPKVGSTSGSGEVIEGLVKKAGLFSKIPGLGEAVESVKKSSASSRVVKGLGEFEPTVTKSKFWGPSPTTVGVSTGVIAGQQGD